MPHALCAVSTINGALCLVQVYAVDLLAFGASAKPIMEYTVELWQDLVVDFLAEFVEGPAMLVGNSLGSLIALAVSVRRCQFPRGMLHADTDASEPATGDRRRLLRAGTLHCRMIRHMRRRDSTRD